MAASRLEQSQRRHLRSTTVFTSQGPYLHHRLPSLSPPTDTLTSPTPPATASVVRRPPMPHPLQIHASALRWKTTQALHLHPSLAPSRRTYTRNLRHHHHHCNNSNTGTRINLVTSLASDLPTAFRHRSHTAARCTRPHRSLHPRGPVAAGAEVGDRRCTCYRRPPR